MTSLKRTVAAACLVGLALTGACSSDDGSSAQPATSSQGSHTVDEAGISFDLPSDWEDFDRDRVVEVLSDSAAMDEMTDRMGVTSEQLRMMLGSDMVLYAGVPNAGAGFRDNLNVTVTATGMPDSASFEQEARQAGATGLSTDNVTTEVGDGYLTTYQLQLNDVEIHGAAIALQVDDKLVVIKVIGTDAGDINRLAEGVLDSLAPTV